jgi:hypothetical protein
MILKNIKDEALAIARAVSVRQDILGMLDFIMWHDLFLTVA